MVTPRFAIKHEFLRYLISGLTAAGTDLFTYTTLLPWVGPSPAKTMSFIFATVIAYILNKFWTFNLATHSWPEMLKFAALYSTSLIANVAMNRISIFVIEDRIHTLLPYEYQFSWLVATGTSTVINYIGQKFWVFKRKNEAMAKLVELEHSDESKP